MLTKSSVLIRKSSQKLIKCAQKNTENLFFFLMQNTFLNSSKYKGFRIFPSITRIYFFHFVCVHIIHEIFQ